MTWLITYLYGAHFVENDECQCLNKYTEGDIAVEAEREQEKKENLRQKG